MVSTALVGKDTALETREAGAASHPDNVDVAFVGVAVSAPEEAIVPFDKMAGAAGLSEVGDFTLGVVVATMETLADSVLCSALLER